MERFSFTTIISCAHKAAGRVFVILQKVYDVAGLLNVVDMLDYLVAILLVELLDKVYGVIGVEKVDEVADLLRVHPSSTFLRSSSSSSMSTSAFFSLSSMRLKSHSACRRLATEKLRYVGGMQLAHLSLGILFILLFNKLFNPFYVSIRKFLHNLQNY